MTENAIPPRPSPNPRPHTQSRLMLAGTLVVGVISTFVVLYALFNRSGTSTQSGVNTGAAIIEGIPYTGVEIIDPPRAVQDFTLIDQDGQPLSLSDLKGELVLLFFGFTNCPDLCPSTLLEYKKTRIALGEMVDEIEFVFISVDTKRDRPAVIKEYLTKFDPAIHGLEGDRSVFEAISRDYNLEFFEEPIEGTDPETDFTVVHSASSFLLNQDGQLVTEFVYGTRSDVLVENIQKQLGE